MGLQLLAEKNGDRATLFDPKLRGDAAVQACTVELTKNPDPEIRLALLQRRGLAYFAMGRYDAARKDLGSRFDVAPYELAFSSFCVGRMGEMMQAIFRGLHESGSAPKFLLLRGGMHFAAEEFAQAADDFTAAQRIDSDEYSLVLRHLALLHLGRGDQSPLLEWSPLIDPETTTWPNALMYFLQGKGNAEVLLMAAKSEGAGAREPLSYARWALAETARLKADHDEERRQLQACLEVGAYSSLPHALVVRRIQRLEEEARWAAGH